MERKSLSDILRNGNGDSLRRQWDATEAAEDFAPLPPGEYVAHTVSGSLFTGRTNGTIGYKLEFKVAEGEHTGRRFWFDTWLTEAALPMAKRDLGKLGITSLDQLELPLPARFRCRCKLVLRKDDDGTEYNRVKRFEVEGIDPPEADPFAPVDVPTDGDGKLVDAAGTEKAEAEAATDTAGTLF
jgi:hypothetical protein